MNQAPEYTIQGINGPVVTVRGGRSLAMQETVYVGKERLVGEVVGLQDDQIVVQVYEDTSGLYPGEPVTPSGGPMSILLGPGLIGAVFDGIARPLKEIENRTGYFMERGINIPSLNPSVEWDVEILVSPGESLTGGQIFAHCQETSVVRHYCMTPPDVSGTVSFAAKSGRYTIEDVLAELTDSRGKTIQLKLAQTWPMRNARPVAARRLLDRPLITGQRVIDFLFPIAKGGCAAIPGPFGAGKTITQHQLAKWSDADIIVYLGCGERGNEMTEALEEFSKLRDPKNDELMLSRTVLIANTSNMPVAAREASIYTGMTIAEYYRDMGYHVAIMADSTSRWAEALREISGRLEEMPAEEGFPAYLPSRLAGFYERAGYMDTLSGKIGSVTVIGAVSPQGADFSEPVTQNTKRFVSCFWALDRQLAYARHFPSVNWTSSYSEYLEALSPWYNRELGPRFEELRKRASLLLLEEMKLMEIVKLIGSDILPDDQKLIIECARVIRLGFLQQNAYHEVDTYVPIKKQMEMMAVIIDLYDSALQLIERNIPISQLKAKGIFDKLIRMKYEVPNDQPELLDNYRKEAEEAVSRTLLDNA